MRNEKKVLIPLLIVLCILLVIEILTNPDWFLSIRGITHKYFLCILSSTVFFFLLLSRILSYIFSLIGKLISDYIIDRLKYLPILKKLFKKPRGEPAPKIQPKVVATCEVKNIQELEKAAIDEVFMERPAAIKGKRSWAEEKKVIDSSKFYDFDLSTSHKMFFIVGEAELGKSTYMLWTLERLLQKGEKKPPFKRIIFLNPERYSIWAQELSEYDSERTLIVIDGLCREGDEDETLKGRFRCLLNLAQGSQETQEGTRIGPFKVLTTIRDEEYEDLKGKFKSLSDLSFVNVFPFNAEEFYPKEILINILEKRLHYYEVPHDCDNVLHLADNLVFKTKNSPAYIHYLIEELNLEPNKQKRVFSENTLEKAPKGMVNLIWQIIKKRCYEEDDTIIPFLLLLLLDKDNSLLLPNIEKYFSEHFFNFIRKQLILANKQKNKIIEKKIDRLKTCYFQKSSRKTAFSDVKGFALKAEWKMALIRGLDKCEDIDEVYRDVANEYKRISNEKFNRLLEKIAIELKAHLQEGLKNKADAFLCVDLAKLSEQNLNDATEIYTKFCSSSKLPQVYINYIRDELYELWISNAWKYRADPRHKPEDVIGCYKNAFDKLGVRSHLKQLSAFAYYLQTDVLPKCKYETQKFQDLKNKIENLHKEVIKGQSDKGKKDPISYLTLALFYEDVGEDEKAEKTFQESLKISPLHIPTSQAYAIFLKGRGKREWVRDRIKAFEYYKKAEDQFKKSIDILEDKEKELGPKEIEKYEKRLLNAYAIFLIDKTEWEREFDKRIKIDTAVDELFNKLLGKYSNHGHSINVYARFLMGYGRILPQYKGEKNLQKAEKLLKDFIEAERNKKEKDLSYFMVLHILAVYYYRQKPAFYKQSPDLEEVERLLKDSSKSFSSYHNSIAYNELGRLYVRWGSNLQKNGEPTAYNEKMNLAKEAYEKAMEIVRENQQSALHLSKVYFNYAFYSQYVGQTEQSETYRQKALEIIEKFAYIPFNHYYSLTALGDEILKDHDLDMGIRVFTEAKQLGERLQIIPWYAIYKLGDIYKEKQDIDHALECYLQSARLENTSEGWGTRRDSIKNLMEDYNIKKDEQLALYEKCTKARIYCSKQAYELNTNDYKNCGDYGEDLSKIGQFKDALPILEQAVNLTLEDSELTEAEKNKKISWLWQEIGYCYRNQEDYSKAEEFWDRSADKENSAIGYFKHTDRMVDLEKYEKAVISFNKFIEKFPSSEEEKKKDIFYGLPKILQKIARSYENLLKKDESTLAWKDYADVSFYSNPKKGARVYGIIGNKLMEKEKFLEAWECFVKSIRIDPNIPKNLRQLGDVDQSLKRWQEGMVCYKIALSKESNSIWIEYNKSGFRLCEREHNNQPKLYDASHVEDLIDQGIIEELNSRIDKALEFYENALILLSAQEPPDRTKALRCRFIADAFWALEKRDNASRLYEERIKDMVVGQEKIVVEAIIWFISSKS